MNKKTIPWILAIAVLFLMLASVLIAYGLGVFMDDDPQKAVTIDEQEVVDQDEDGSDADVSDYYISDEIRVNNIDANDVVASPLFIEGEAAGWYFEASFRILILDENGEEIGSGLATAKEDWMTSDFVPFEANVEFNSGNSKIGVIEFQKANPAGDARFDRSYELPVQFKESDTMVVKVFYNNTIKDPDLLDCRKVYPSNQVIPRTQSVGRAALKVLLLGPTSQEKLEGFVGGFNPGVKVQSLEIKNGTAYVDFNNKLQEGVGGSCNADRIRAQIEETLKQFPTVLNVEISIDGETEAILQP